MRTKLMLIVVLLAASTGFAMRQGAKKAPVVVGITQLTGNDLLERCESKDAYGNGICLGYVEAIRDAFLIGSETPPFATPVEVTNQQLVDVVVKYLKDHPQRRHLQAAFLAREAYVAMRFRRDL